MRLNLPAHITPKRRFRPAQLPIRGGTGHSRRRRRRRRSASADLLQEPVADRAHEDGAAAAVDHDVPRIADLVPRDLVVRHRRNKRLGGRTAGDFLLRRPLHVQRALYRASGGVQPLKQLQPYTTSSAIMSLPALKTGHRDTGGSRKLRRLGECCQSEREDAAGR